MNHVLPRKTLDAAHALPAGCARRRINDARRAVLWRAFTLHFTFARFALISNVMSTIAAHAIAPARAIAELRRLSGLTWEQLAALLSVTRRSLHLWASGKAMNAADEEHLRRVLHVVRAADRGSARVNRSALLAVRKDGRSYVDLLARGSYEAALGWIRTSRVPRVTPPSVSDRERAARAPQPPAELVDAMQDRIPVRSGRLLAAKPVRVPRSK